MKIRNLSARTSALIAITASLIFAHSAFAADGTWTLISSGNASGTWIDSAPTNWAGDIVADGAGFTARFDTLDITANSTIALGAPRTIGTIVFGDATPASAANWTLNNNSTPANILTLGGAATITVDAMSSVNNTGSNVTISAIIDGVDGLTKNGTGTNTTGTNNTAGTGTLTLSGANTYAGATNIDTGTIRATNALAFGGVAGGKLATNVVNVASGARLLLSGVTIANTVNLNGANALAVAGGSSNLSGIVNLQSNSTAYVHNGGNYTLTFSGTLNLGSNVLTLQTTGTNNGAIISGTITGSGGITKNGNGPLTMSGDGTGYSGITSLYSGEILLGSNTGLGTGTFLIAPPNNGSVTIRSTDTTARTIAAAISLPTTTNNGNTTGLFNFGSTNPALNGNLTFTNTTDISLAGATRAFQVHNRTEFDAGFTGATRGITMQVGTGTLVLNGVNTYTGATTVNAGTLLVNGSLASGSAVTVGASGTLGGSGTIDGAATVNGSLNPGDGSGVLSFGNVLNLAGTTVFELNGITRGAQYDGIDVTGGLTNGGVLSLSFGSAFLTGGETFDLFALTGGQSGDFSAINLIGSYTGSLTNNSGVWTGTVSGLDFTYTQATGDLGVVPEPSTWALLAGAGTFLLVLRRRRKL